MEMWYWIILLLIIGLGLVIAEIVFIPGSAFLAIGGLIFAVIGIYLAFSSLGITAGFITLGGFSALTALIIYFGFKSGTWRRFALTHAIGSRVNDDRTVLLQIGEVGKAISALRPAGKAEFGNAVVEVTTLSGFLPDGCPIKIIRISSGKIFVEPAS